MIKIKNCPFCKSEPSIVRQPLWHDSHGYMGKYKIFIECSNPKCKVSLPNGVFYTLYNSEQETLKQAIEAWNDRK